MDDLHLVLSIRLSRIKTNDCYLNKWFVQKIKNRDIISQTLFGT